MARKTTERYVRYYTFGSAAAKLERAERRASLPQYKTPQKRKPINVDPVALLGNVVALLLAVLMIVGMAQVAHTTSQVHDLQTQVISLEKEQEMLLEQYHSGYDLDEIRVAAESMGMVSAEAANRVSVNVTPPAEAAVQLGWWDSLLLNLRQIFA